MFKSYIIPVIMAIIPFCYTEPASASHPGLKVAMVQMDVVDGNLTENMKRAGKFIREAAGLKADLVCLPEASDLGWLCQTARKDACPIPGRYTDFLSCLAKELKIWISAGCLEKDGEKIFNSAVLIDRSGSIVLKHRKISTLPKLTAHLYEQGSADDIKTVDTEFGRVGITICADNFNIENPGRVAALEAWLLIAPHGFAAEESDMADNAISFMNHIKKVAGETKLWVIGTNTSLSVIAGGEWKGRPHSGCSTIASPGGKAVTIGRFKVPDLIIFDIPTE
jgi:predicted amidohydrolase